MLHTWSTLLTFLHISLQTKQYVDQQMNRKNKPETGLQVYRQLEPPEVMQLKISWRPPEACDQSNDR